jgi:hypothetical protein
VVGGWLEEEVAGWGFAIAGGAKRPHRIEPRLASRVFWIDGASGSSDTV